MRTELTTRFSYGLLTAWLERDGADLVTVSGPDALRLATPAELAEHDGSVVAEFTVYEGDRVPFVLVRAPGDVVFGQRVASADVLAAVAELHG